MPGPRAEFGQGIDEARIVLGLGGMNLVFSSKRMSPSRIALTVLFANSPVQSEAKLM